MREPRDREALRVCCELAKGSCKDALICEYVVSTYGGAIAARYDEITKWRNDTAVAVAALANFAGHGRALELGIYSIILCWAARQE